MCLHERWKRTWQGCLSVPAGERGKGARGRKEAADTRRIRCFAVIVCPIKFLNSAFFLFCSACLADGLPASPWRGIRERAPPRPSSTRTLIGNATSRASRPLPRPSAFLLEHYLGCSLSFFFTAPIFRLVAVSCVQGAQDLPRALHRRSPVKHSAASMKPGLSLKGPRTPPAVALDVTCTLASFYRSCDNAIGAQSCVLSASASVLRLVPFHCGTARVTKP